MAQWRRMARFHPSTSKNPLRSRARAIGRAKLCHRFVPQGWSPATLWHAARRNIGGAGLIGDFSPHTEILSKFGQWYGL
jgi:hypothetical protein